MEEGTAAHGADLAVAEHAREGRIGKLITNACGVMVGDLEHVRPASVAREDEPAGGRKCATICGARRAKHRPQVLVRRLGVTHMKSERLPDAYALADVDRPRVGVTSDDAPHQEVAALVLGLVLVDDDAGEQRLVDPPPLLLPERLNPL